MSDNKLARLMARRISRRQFLRYSAATGVGVYLGAGTMSAWAQGVQGAPSPGSGTRRSPASGRTTSAPTSRPP